MEKPKKIPVEVADVLKGVKFDRPADEEGQHLYPTVFDLLCPRWKDGVQTRKSGKLTIRVDGGAYRVVMECPQEGVQASFLVDSLEGLLTAVELQVGSGRCHWTQTWAQQKKNSQRVDEPVQ